MKHFVRIQSNVLDLISAEDNITIIRHMHTHFNLDLFEVEISEAVFQAIMDNNFTIDCNFGLDVIEINGEAVVWTLESFGFLPKFVLPLPIEALQLLKSFGTTEENIRLYAYKNLLWVKNGWGDSHEMNLSQQIGNFCFRVPTFDIPGEFTEIEIYKGCDNGNDYLHIAASDVDVYINIVQIM